MTVSVVLFLAFLMLLAFLLTIMRSKRDEPERSRKPRQPFRPQPRYRFRLAWYKLTRRMPRYKGGNEGGRPLSARERRVLDAIRSAEKRRQPLAAEPRCAARGRSRAASAAAAGHAPASCASPLPGCLPRCRALSGWRREARDGPGPHPRTRPGT